MAVWSSTFRALAQNIIKYRGLVPKNIQNNVSIVRNMSAHGPRIFPLQPSRWQWHKTKDLFHFYFMLGIIPVTIVITGSYIFVGPATLQQIPEGYTPKHWEYFRNPITRFLARYIYSSPQQEYEKSLHAIWVETEKMKLRQLEARVRALMKERRDVQAYYWRPSIAKYHRETRQVHKDLRDMYGE